MPNFWALTPGQIGADRVRGCKESCGLSYLPSLKAPALGLSSHICTQRQKRIPFMRQRGGLPPPPTKHPSGKLTKESGQTLPSRLRCCVPVPAWVGEPRLAEKPAQGSPSAPASGPGISSLTPETQTVSGYKSDVSCNTAALAQKEINQRYPG